MSTLAAPTAPTDTNIAALTEAREYLETLLVIISYDDRKGSYDLNLDFDLVDKYDDKCDDLLRLNQIQLNQAEATNDAVQVEALGKERAWLRVEAATDDDDWWRAREELDVDVEMMIKEADEEILEAQKTGLKG